MGPPPVLGSGEDDERQHHAAFQLDVVGEVADPVLDRGRVHAVPTDDQEVHVRIPGDVDPPLTQ